MPKLKYVYQNKKLLKDGVKQEQKDFNYFCSPQYAKIIGQKYGLKGEVIERAFKQYFEAMKHLGLTQLINKDKLRKHVNNMNIFHEYELGGRTIQALTDILEGNILLRKSAKKGYYGYIFHEFNHLISINNHIALGNYNKKTGDGLKLITGYDREDLITREAMFSDFNEGVTQFLACLQISYLNKRPIVLPNIYLKGTSYAHSLYLICGSALFEGYFNGGDFQYITKAIPNTTVEDVMSFADKISEFNNSYYGSPVDVIELDYSIHMSLLEMFNKKVCADIINNLDKFNSFFDIQKVLIKGYCNYANSLIFDSIDNSILNINRFPVFESMKDSFFTMLDKIAENIKMNPQNVKFKCNFESPNEELIEKFGLLLEMTNDHNYGFVDFATKPINVIDYLNDPVISLHDMGKASYLRRKQCYSNVKFMKNYELYEKKLEIFTNQYETNCDDTSDYEICIELDEQTYDENNIDETNIDETNIDETCIAKDNKEVNKRKGSNPGRNM